MEPDHNNQQIPLFPEALRAVAANEAQKKEAQESAHGNGRAGKRVMINPHLLAARRIARKMRQLPSRSDAETRAGLAICAELKAFIREDLREMKPRGEEPARH